ncbi:RelA/SpoT family protein [Desulfofalx alkaliphila]|uniref:RelA/SpoT family protein n=1 Tax=Desulfofalx alkaliphila TaxID=105483 RepID=UPI0004E20C3F|nr:bifunctional (p)ppGpp synthetase/guanosine-3',5'-bis(diphosphate) 3'-pyrophosphohydrolase [Desulfofalx alkaliphila]
MSLAQLTEKIKSYNATADIAFLRKAYRYAEWAHFGQKRISGEDYFIHPVEVANILADMHLDMETVVGALLHDVVEDTGVTLEDIEHEFGEQVALLVDGVTKLKKLEFKSKVERQAENLRKMFLAMAKDIRVVLIKLADRLHNLRTLNYQTEAKQREKAEETLEIFAPLAHRLGIYRIKWELEDISFRYRYPEEYYRLKELVAATRQKREEFIQRVIDTLSVKLEDMDIQAEIKGRPKNFYSIYQKMKQQQKDFTEIYDVLAVRIIVETVKDCYGALGIAHTLWKPIPGRFKDYIAMPKTNMYQSLHTTVIGPSGEPFEIQIRTFDMHRTAEYGIAAHWRYKENIKGETAEQKMVWLRQLLDWQHDLRDAREFMEGLKIDIFAHSVFVFTPKGDVVELPAGSIPIDFAYRIHTDVGHRCIGAKVNGRIVPLDYKLKNGDITEIITKKSGGPSRDWLNIVKTSQAKARIKNWFKKEKKEENITKGKELLEREIRKQGLDLSILKSDQLLEVGRKLSLNSVDDIFAAVGDAQITPLMVLGRLKDGLNPPEKNLTADDLVSKKPGKGDWGKPTQGIRVKGIDNLLIRLAQCCNPVPGDDISGYITRGRGVSIHRSDCKNLKELQAVDPERLVEVTWDKNFDSSFHVKLEVTGMDRAGLLNDVLNVLLEMKINTNWVTARTRKDRMATIELALHLKSIEQMEFVLNKIKRVKDIYTVRRIAGGQSLAH